MDATELRRDFGGAIVTEGDGRYEEARSIFNSMIDRRPALIAQCESAEDVAAALAFARPNELEVAIRGGGHSVTGASLTDGGLVVDMRRMNSVSVDAAARTATVQGGAVWGDFDRATQPHGLMSTGGRVSTTGVAGLTLGGGSGWLERKFGFACDSLESVDLVTADGRPVTASESENPELFWALHGGGGNFGVATELVFRLQPLPVVTFALLLWPAADGPEVSRRYRDLMDGGAPEELGGAFAYITGPPEEFVPEHLRGELVSGLVLVYAGGEGEAREAIAPILELEPAGLPPTEMPYAEIQCAIDDPPGYRNYWSAEHLASLPDEALEIFCRRAGDMVVPSPSQHILFPWGGAATAGAGDWPLPHREANWVAHPLGLWEDPDDDERAIAWARGLCAALRPYSTGSVYLNFDSESEDHVEAGFGRENYARLAAVKADYDPDDVFHLHHDIKPLQPV
ncbi:MAG: FAD-binding protein [Solirubrobacterales bacterium]|nr:FAD-binding protein [Solirubrobacterales bacterium]